MIVRAVGAWRSGNVAVPVEAALVPRPGHVLGPASGAVAAYLGRQSDAQSQVVEAIGDVQQQTVERAAHQLGVDTTRSGARILVISSVDPAAHELHPIHAMQLHIRH
jgi:hypothetical protein